MMANIRSAPRLSPITARNATGNRSREWAQRKRKAAGVIRRFFFFGTTPVTNAVKHFKFETRGKRRLHKRPDTDEIQRCKWWNDIEWRLVRPELVVALGASAARSLTGKTVKIQAVRGRLLRVEDDLKLVITVHPSSLLRIPVRADRRRQFGNFVEDLGKVGGYLEAH